MIAASKRRRKKTVKLRIELRSDLCVGSGYSYAGIIDTDTYYDDYGLPYIPARRLKGCLKEVARLIDLDQNVIKDLFGEIGQDNIHNKACLRISDANIVGHDAIVEEIESNSEFRELLKPQNIIDQYSTIKTQTKIGENGVAEEGSLRFTRTVNEHGITNKTNLVFVSDVTITDHLDAFEKLVKGLRHIGLDRNRGLGNVSCTLLKDEEKTEKVIPQLEEEKIYRLQYALKNTDSLVICNDDDQTSESYISGTSVLGNIANNYLREKEADDEFDDLFLKDNLIFTPAYPSKNGKTYFPAYTFINSLKKTGEYVNMMCYDQRESGKTPDPDNGNRPKNLNGKYIYFDDNKVDCIEVKEDIVYHNRHERKDDDIEQQLYTLKVIKKGQTFQGEIIGKGKYLNEITQYVSVDNTMQFGKSKNAQYGTCLITDVQVKSYEKHSVDSGKIVVVLESDALFMNERGYTVKTDEVRSLIQKQLALDVIDDENYTNLNIKKIGGFYGAWNLRKQSIPVVEAGSAFEFTCNSTNIDLVKALGEKINEGFGLYSIYDTKDMKWPIEKMEQKEKENKQAGNEKISSLVRNIILEQTKEELGRISMEKKVDLNPTKIGRLTLMLNESNGNYVKFREAVNSIKDEDTREKCTKFLNGLFGEKETNQMAQILLENDTFQEFKKLYEHLNGQGKTYEEQLNELWPYYLKSILVSEKYRKGN